MSRKKIPSLRRHKSSGQGVVTFGGRDVYCGSWPASQKSPPAEVEDRYRKAVAEWLAAGFPPLGNTTPAVPVKQHQAPRLSSAITVEEVLAAFLKHATRYYVKPDGTETSELGLYMSVMRTIRKLYGPVPASDFGPLALKAVRQEFINQGLTRGVCNSFTSKARSIFKWAAGNELIPGSVPQALACVAGLRSGRSEARETMRILPPAEEVINEVLGTMPEPLLRLFRCLHTPECGGASCSS